MIFENQKQAEECLAHWQRILRLQDWGVKIVVQRHLEDGKEASTTVYASLKLASILLLDPLDYPEDCKWPQDHEQALVHELLHLPCDILHRAYNAEMTDGVWLAQEQLIDLTAHALVKLNRRDEI